MAQQTIGIGTTADDDTGDTLRTAGDKTNDNFDELYALASKAPGVLKIAACSTAAVTLVSDVENADTLDGVTLSTGDYILLKDQADASENGVYEVAASGVPSRVGEVDSEADLVGFVCIVTGGTANADKLFICTTDAPITVDTTNLAFSEISGSGGGGSETITIALSDLTSDLATGTGKGYWDPPFPITLSAVEATVFEAPTGSAIQVDVNEAGVSILSTVISIDDGELRSIDSATPAVISDSAITNRLTFDIDQVGSTTTGKGAQVTLTYTAA